MKDKNLILPIYQHITIYYVHNKKHKKLKQNISKLIYFILILSFKIVFEHFLSNCCNKTVTALGKNARKITQQPWISLARCICKATLDWKWATRKGWKKSIQPAIDPTSQGYDIMTNFSVSKATGTTDRPREMWSFSSGSDKHPQEVLGQLGKTETCNAAARTSDVGLTVQLMWSVIARLLQCNAGERWLLSKHLQLTIIQNFK